MIMAKMAVVDIFTGGVGAMISATQKEICRRIKAYRLAYPMTQKELAEKTGLSLRSIQNLENEKDTHVSTMLTILDYLGLGDSILTIIPDPDDRPSVQMLKAKGKIKQRVRKKKTDAGKTFVWGDGK